MIFVISGCASSTGPEVLSVPSKEYSRAFDTAVEVARKEGLPAVLRDRRAGVIETEPLISGSIIEPWRGDNASFAQAVANTVSFQRRRVRFEFAPAGFIEPETTLDTELTGPDMLGAKQTEQTDLTQFNRPLALRVWAYVERAHEPGVQRSTWTRRLTTHAIDPLYAVGDQVESERVGQRWEQEREAVRRTWTPIARDKAFERRLLAAVAGALETQ